MAPDQPSWNVELIAGEGTSARHGTWMWAYCVRMNSKIGCPKTPYRGPGRCCSNGDCRPGKLSAWKQRFAPQSRTQSPLPSSLLPHQRAVCWITFIILRGIPRMRMLTYGEAIREAHAQLLASDPRVILLGQGVWSPWYAGSSLKDMDKEFGRARVVDSTVSENATTGAAIGAAICGLRPIVFHPRMDFMLLA